MVLHSEPGPRGHLRQLGRFSRSPTRLRPHFGCGARCLLGPRRWALGFLCLMPLGAPHQPAGWPWSLVPLSWERPPRLSLVGGVRRLVSGVSPSGLRAGGASLPRAPNRSATLELTTPDRCPGHSHRQFFVCVCVLSLLWRVDAPRLGAAIHVLGARARRSRGARHGLEGSR